MEYISEAIRSHFEKAVDLIVGSEFFFFLIIFCVFVQVAVHFKSVYEASISHGSLDIDLFHKLNKAHRLPFGSKRYIKKNKIERQFNLSNDYSRLPIFMFMFLLLLKVISNY